MRTMKVIAFLAMALLMAGSTSARLLPTATGVKVDTPVVDDTTTPEIQPVGVPDATTATGRNATYAELAVGTAVSEPKLQPTPASTEENAPSTDPEDTADDTISIEGAEDDGSPALEALAGNSTRFKTAAVTAPAGGCSDVSTILSETNRYRARHRAPAITWNNDLAQKARAWSQTLVNGGCGLRHSSMPYGENLYGLYGNVASRKCNPANVLWYNEVKNYRFTSTPWTDNSARFSIIGHFTQVVWKSTRQMGCGIAASSRCVVVTCEYSSAGNVVTNSYFKANVLPA